MKTIFLGDAARDSGSFGFSEACPLFHHSLAQDAGQKVNVRLPTILPKRHGHPFAPRRRQLTRRSRSCGYLSLQEPRHNGLPCGYNRHSLEDLPGWPSR